MILVRAKVPLNKVSLGLHGRKEGLQGVYLDDVSYVLNRGVEAVLMILEMVDLVGLGKLEHTLSAFTDSLETEDVLDLCVYGHDEVKWAS